MSIIRAEIETFFLPENINDGPTNGGRMTANPIPDGVIGNIFPPAGSAERAAGSTKQRKIFAKNSNLEGPPLLDFINTGLYVELFTPGDDAIYIYEGDQVNTQTDLTGTEDRYGAGDLDSDILSAATSIDVAVEDGSVVIFRNGDLVRISDKANIDDVTPGTKDEFVQINGVPSVTLDVWTLPITATVNGFLAANTRVASVLQTASVGVTFSNLVVTSGAGTFDLGQVDGNNEGSRQENITFTFTDATNYNVTGDAGLVGSGTIGGTFSPTNTDFGQPFFTVPPAAWGGTYAAADTVVFDVNPASRPIWVERIVPAGAGSLTGNNFVVAFRGDSSA